MLLERQSRRLWSHANDHPPNLAQENEALKQKLADMQALLAAASKPKALALKVSEKGAISVYGLGRFPITLYRGQMERSSITTSPFKPSSPPTRPCSPRSPDLWHLAYHAQPT